MKLLSAIATLLLTYSSYCQPNTISSSWYKCMKGMIGKYPVTMHLHKSGNDYSGFYYYERSQEPISFFGKDSSDTFLHLEAYLPGPSDEAEIFSGSWNGDICAGTWLIPGKTSVLDFSLKVVRDSLVPNFTVVYTSGEAVLRKTLKNSPKATFSASSVWPTNNLPSTNFIKQQLNEISGGGHSEAEIGKTLLKQKNIYLKGYIDDIKETDKEIMEMGESLNYEESSKVMVAYCSSRLLTIASNYYGYTGGAHGNYGSYFYVLDLQHQKRLKLSDVINKNDSAKLSKLLEKKIRTIYKLKPTEKLTELLFEETIWPNDDFYVTSKGIGFNYSPYEIAAYAFGEIRLFIPFSELTGIVRNEFLQFLQPIK